MINSYLTDAHNCMQRRMEFCKMPTAVKPNSAPTESGAVSPSPLRRNIRDRRPGDSTELRSPRFCHTPPKPDYR